MQANSTSTILQAAQELTLGLHLSPSPHTSWKKEDRKRWSREQTFCWYSMPVLALPEEAHFSSCSFQNVTEQVEAFLPCLFWLFFPLTNPHSISQTLYLCLLFSPPLPAEFLHRESPLWSLLLLPSKINEDIPTSNLKVPMEHVFPCIFYSHTIFYKFRLKFTITNSCTLFFFFLRWYPLPSLNSSKYSWISISLVLIEIQILSDKTTSILSLRCFWSQSSLLSHNQHYNWHQPLWTDLSSGFLVS